MADIDIRGPEDGSEEEEAKRAPGGGLSGVAVRRPVFTTMMMFGLIVLGIFGFRRLPIDEFPDVDIPVVAVQTVYPGASPETIEREVTRRLEEAFNTVEGVDRITSNSLEGVSSVVVEFDLGRDGDLASQDIRARIDGVRRDLPTEIEAPVVQKFDPSAQPILSLALSSSTLSVPELTTLADETIRRSFEAVSGVGQVQIAGGLEREIRVNLLPERMQAVGVSAQEIMGALQRQNLEVPAGRVERGTGEQLVRVTGRITDPAQFNDVIVASRNGMTVRLSDVARVEDATEEERSLALVDDRRAVSLDVLKVSGANTVEVADGVKEAIAELQTQLPAGAQLTVVRDNSVSIRQSVDDVIHELVLGAILTVVVVMLFLNDWKATAITSLALPVSVISAFMLMDALGFTLTILTLMGLSLSIGILVDDAIVVIENIVRHRSELKEGPREAASKATAEIGLAVLATTMSIVAVFVPVSFMEGMVGQFFYEFGLTVAFAVLLSLFVSFTLTPMLSARMLTGHHAAPTGISGVIERGLTGLDNTYRRTIRWALRHRVLTTLA
ncbi:MAG TPA: efflux RND transporter permease subunit, partial [Longimicrobium sp.]|nr:efflux RND transporter permease subunit [Longimicrobium sp.]